MIGVAATLLVPVSHVLSSSSSYRSISGLCAHDVPFGRGESGNKVRMDVWVELGLGFKRFADKADAQAEGSGGA